MEGKGKTLWPSSREKGRHRKRTKTAGVICHALIRVNDRARVTTAHCVSDLWKKSLVEKGQSSGLPSSGRVVYDDF